ncbi:MAG: hypothetical protein AB8G26_05880 [Ilumatobacter sp.]
MIQRTVPRLLRTTAVSLAIAATAASCASSSSSDEAGEALPAAAGPADDEGAADGDAPVDDSADDDGDNVRIGGDEDEDGDQRIAEGDLDVGEIAISAADDATISTLDDGRTVVQGDIVVPTAGGDLELENADIAVGVGPDGEPTISGTAQVPFPTEGAFADAQINQLPVGEVGSAYGRDLVHLGAHLQNDTRYLFFSFDGGLDVELPFGGQEGFEAVPTQIAVPTGQSATLVIDPSDPYFYVGSNCPDLSKDDEDSDDDQNDDSDRDQSDDRNDNDRNNNDSEDDEDRDSAADQDDDEESGAYYTLEPSNLPAGQECGIGISINGNIPAPATAAGGEFTGHVVVDGVVPLYAGIELDGSAVVALRDPGARTVGWGTVQATVPLIDDWVDIQIPLANAAVEIQAEGTRIGVAYEGSLGDESPSYELPLIGVPITLPANGTVEWDARFGFVESGGEWSLDPESFAEVSGEFGLGFSSFGDLLGVELDDFATQSGSFRIDRTGVTASGATELQIHPSLQTGAATQFDLRIDATDWTQSQLDFAADVEVAGYDLASADVSIGGTGLAVAGEVDLGFVRSAVSGTIGADGFEFTGSAGVEVSLDGLAQASRNTSDWLQDRIDEVQRLDDDIEAAREDVRESRRNRDAGFTAARDWLQEAIDNLNELDDETDENNDKIAELRGKIADEIAWYEGLTPLEKIGKSVGHLARLSAWRTDIGVRNTRNFAIDDVYRPAAVGVLTGAQEALDLVQAGLDALPVDTNPKVASLIAAKVIATEALELAQGTVELFEIEGSLKGDISVRLASDGVGGSFSGELCGPNNCTALPGGSLQLGAETSICVELPGVGERCLTL